MASRRKIPDPAPPRTRRWASKQGRLPSTSACSHAPSAPQHRRCAPCSVARLTPPRRAYAPPRVHPRRAGGWDDTTMRQSAKRPNLHSTACWRGYERHEHDEDGWCLECDKCLIVDPLADIVAGVARMALECGMRLEIEGEPGEELYRLAPE